MNQTAIVVDQLELDDFLTAPRAGDRTSTDWESLESEDKLGCARGILWAILFEAATVVAAVAIWKLHLLAH
jgi:hypothetical protein